MRGLGMETDSRGVSELYGTVIIISLAFLTAILLIAVGTVVIDELQGETDESLSQDSMQVMDDRLAELSGSDVNASTQFQFPDGSGEVSADPDEGAIRIHVEATNFNEEYLQTEEPSSSTTVRMGTITHVTEDNLVTAWQGGGLWEHERGVTRIISPPPLEFDGTTLRLPLVNLKEVDRVPQGRDITATLDAASSEEATSAVQELFRKHWTVAPEGDLGVIGTDQVDVRVTIESQYVGGWAEYAMNSMNQPPDHIDPALDDITEETDEITLYFNGVGTPLSNQIKTNHTDWEVTQHSNLDVLYSGNSSYAIFNTAIEPVEGGGFVVNRTLAAETMPSDPSSTDIHLAVYHFDEKDYVVYDAENDEWTDADNNPLDQSTLDALEHQLGDFDETITPATDDHLDGDQGYRVYDFEGPQAICVYAGSPGGGGGTGFYNQADIPSDCGDTFAIEGDPVTLAEGTNYEIEDMTVEIGGSEVDTGQHSLADGEEVTVTADINNTGDIGEEQSVVMTVGNVHLAATDVEVTPGTTKSDVTLSHTVDAEDLYYKLDGTGELKLETSQHTAPKASRDQYELGVDWEPSEPAVNLSVEITDVTYPHWNASDSREAVNPDPDTDGEDYVELDVTVTNEDNRDSGDELLTLAYWDFDAQTYRTVTVDEVQLDGGESDTTRIRWEGVNNDGNLLDNDEVATETHLRLVFGDDVAEEHDVLISRAAS